jgi:hypothetical protein
MYGGGYLSIWVIVLCCGVKEFCGFGIKVEVWVGVVVCWSEFFVVFWVKWGDDY